MNKHIPPGYIEIRDALDNATKLWRRSEVKSYIQQISAVNEKAKIDIKAKPNMSALIERASAKLIYQITLDNIDPILNKTKTEFCDALLNGDIVAYYFTKTDKSDSPMHITISELANSSLDDIIEKGIYTNESFNIQSVHVLIRANALDRILPGVHPEFFLKRPPGRPETTRKLVREKMKLWDSEQLSKLTHASMEEYFEASAGTCVRARKEVLLASPKSDS